MKTAALHRSDRLAAARADLDARPDGVLEAIADAHRLLVVDVLGLLPVDRAWSVDGRRFEAIWTELTGWGPLLFLVHGRNGVFEIETPLPAGTARRGWFDVHGDAPLGGHLRADRCASIWFVDRPFFGRRSCSIWFVDVDGDAMFKVFVARNAERVLDAGQLARFEALRDALVGSDDPPV